MERKYTPQTPCWLRLDPSRTYVVADLHLLHRNLVELSGRPPDFTERLIDALSSLPPGSTLIVLGDVALSKKGASLLKGLPPQFKILVKGNHDRIRHYGLDNIFDVICTAGFSRVRLKKNVSVNVYLFHYPVPARDVERSIGYHVDYVLSGHTHKPPFFDPENRVVNLSPEVAGYRPHNLLGLIKIVSGEKRRIESVSEL